MLILVSSNSNIIRLSRSLPGVDIKAVENLNLMDLLPGSKPIRLTLFSENAVNVLTKFGGFRAKLGGETE